MCRSGRRCGASWLTLRAVLGGLYVQIRDMEKILELGGQQIESAQQTTAEELKLYNQGRGSLTFVIQSRDNEQNARLAQAGNVLRFLFGMKVRRPVDAPGWRST